jgi:cytochrome P450
MDFNPYSRKLHADPYSAYREIQENFPVYFNSRFGFWVISRYDDVAAALKDWQTYSSASGITLQSFSGFKPMIILMDPPRQAELRALLQRAFTPRRIAGLEDRMREIARDLIAALRQSGSGDFVRAFAAPYPTTVIAELLGIDAKDREQFKVWSDMIMTSSSIAGDSLKEAYDGIFAYFAQVIANRRPRPGKDLVSALVNAEAEGKKLTEDELLGFCALLLIAGNETMANFLSNVMLTLHLNREVRQDIVAQPALLPWAIEELLRFEPSVHELGRTMTCDVELRGQKLSRGDRVLLLIAAANRDPRKFSAPDRIDIRRHPNEHLSFGLGTHYCLGASLARLEARVALEELLRAIPNYRVTAEEISWFRTPSVRGPASLPIKF